MENRIYTRSGDAGQTSLVDGSRAPKDSLRVEAYGTMDEANSWVGAARVFSSRIKMDRALEFLQHRLYNCSSSLATPPNDKIDPPCIAQADVDWLEDAIDFFQKTSGELKSFVVPGGCGQAGFLHVARTVCRRAERLIVALAAKEAVEPMVLKFVNRSSDFLFAAARYVNAVSGAGDVIWQPDIKAHKL
jgi:cob(I)alamin adenosyltransferase